MTQTLNTMNTIDDLEFAIEIEDAVEEGINDRGGYWEYGIDESAETRRVSAIIKGPNVGNWRIKFSHLEARDLNFVRQKIESALPLMGKAFRGCIAPC